jgi:hypothetical protein
MSDRVTRSGIRTRAQDEDALSDGEQEVHTPPPPEVNPIDHVVPPRSRQDQMAPDADVLEPLDTPTMSRARSGRNSLDDLAAARQWLEDQRNAAELERINQIRRRIDAGDMSALYEDTRALITTQPVVKAQSLRPPTHKQPTEFTRKDRREYNRWRDDCELTFKSSPEYFISDEKRIDFALQFVNDVCRTVWRSEVSSFKIADLL